MNSGTVGGTTATLTRGDVLNFTQIRGRTTPRYHETRHGQRNGAAAITYNYRGKLVLTAGRVGIRST